MATTRRDTQDTRHVGIQLTPEGEEYAHAVVKVVATLNRDLAARMEADQLAAPKAALLVVRRRCD